MLFMIHIISFLKKFQERLHPSSNLVTPKKKKLVKPKTEEPNVSIFIKKANYLDLYTRIDEQLYSMVNINEDLFITTSGGHQTSTNFWRIQFEKEDLIDRQLQIKPNIQDVTSNCQFTLKGES